MAPAGLLLRLPFRRPLHPDSLFGHLAATAVPGVEEVRSGAYRRTLRLAHGCGVVELTPAPDHISCRLWLSDLRDLTAAITRCRWLLDLDADPMASVRNLHGVAAVVRAGTYLSADALSAMKQRTEERVATLPPPTRPPGPSCC